MDKLTTFMPTAEATAGVTIPSILELELAKVDCRLNDFALFTGAMPRQTKSAKASGEIYGSVWTTNLFDHHAIFALSVDNVFNNLPVRTPTMPHAKSVAVAPRFVHPAKHGLGVCTSRGKDYLTMFGEKVYFPQGMAVPFNNQALFNAIAHGQVQPLNNLPYRPYANVNPADNFSPISNPYANYPTFYRFQGENYALYSYPNQQTGQIQYYCFNCEPIRVKRDDVNDALQCVNPLFAACYEPVISQTSLVQYLSQPDRSRFLRGCQEGKINSCRNFHIDPQYTPLGYYLNTGFMNQLAMSTNFDKADELQAQNNPELVK